ncbi:NUDIX hydrolase [Skermania piniformis]|uniref:NUDIX hydrolase n=1 Tax=Skermania pinensis TaxID=39122 RepID=A0ABX8S9W5_9ACTN|nr:NUDIX hydrolase [Skermania piniformis]QXQ13275.1 NUDIX hydrolase [Skermania piniformis]
MSTASLHASAVELLHAWQPTGTAAESLRYTMLAFLDAAPRACLREHVPGHITASTFLLSDDGERVLLTLHPRIGRWVQLGGHCEESDSTVVDAALREAVEESGIPGVRIEPQLYAVHVHPITCSLGVPTRHLDLQFLAYAPAGAVPVRSDESDDLRWFPVDRMHTV